jgi:thiamine-phosphate pyrophosphorylase
MRTPFSLYLISPEQQFENEIEAVIQLLNKGLHAYHLRKPDWSIEMMREWLQSVPVNLHGKIILHSHFDLAKEFGARGIHLNENNRKLISELADCRIISGSFHSLADIKEHRFSYEYVFLSPIFDSISKVGYNSNFDMGTLATELADMGTKTTPPIIALGGISAENIQQVQKADFSGAALLGSVWQSENPVKAFLEIQSIVNSTS